MAIEDGKMMEFSPEMIQKLIQGRRDRFHQMMEDVKNLDYEIVDLREEANWTARLAIKKAHPGNACGCFIVCPGGGFLFKSWNEALPVAEYFYQQGINVAILDYHVKTDEGLMLVDPDIQRMAGEDGLQAIRYLRLNAERYNILPDHIAIGGFSAGGMLSGYAATKYDDGRKDASDPLRTVSSRPDAALILYGAFSNTSSVPPLTGGMTREEIAKANQLDTIRNIHVDCPPMFVFQTHGDDPRIALNFCMELAVHGVPYEIHTFEEGPHGGGLYNGQDETPDLPHTAMWASIAADWLKSRGY